MSVKRIGIILIGLLALATIAGILLKRRLSSTSPPTPVAVRQTQVGGVFGYEIVGEYPHDTEAYTQGLVYVDGFLYESTGITDDRHCKLWPKVFEIRLKPQLSTSDN